MVVVVRGDGRGGSDGGGGCCSSKGLVARLTESDEVEVVIVVMGDCAANRLVFLGLLAIRLVAIN